MSKNREKSTFWARIRGIFIDSWWGKALFWKKADSERFREVW